MLSSSEKLSIKNKMKIQDSIITNANLTNEDFDYITKTAEEMGKTATMRPEWIMNNSLLFDIR